jgi:prevent-host-death family protein
MATSVLPPRQGIYQDKVFQATDLNRKHAHVLDCARKGPVTISRNNELFALLPREQAAELVHSVHVLKEITEVLAAALVAARGGDALPLHWVNAFDLDDVTAMREDLMAAIAAAGCGDGTWSDVESLLHQWRESGLALKSGVLSDALSDGNPDPDDGDLTITAEGTDDDGDER